MRLVVVEGLDLTAVAAIVDARTYARGLVYARRGAVRAMEWDADQCLMDATVRGSNEQLYDTTVFFDPGPRGEPAFACGECSCAVGYD